MKAMAVLAALVCAHTHAGVTVTLIDLPIAGSPRILDVRPDGAIATLVTIPGGNGVYDIISNALPNSVGGRCSPLARNALAFAANGIAVVLVDRVNYDHPSILQWLWNRDGIPVWPSGGQWARQPRRRSMQRPPSSLRFRRAWWCFLPWAAPVTPPRSPVLR